MNHLSCHMKSNSHPIRYWQDYSSARLSLSGIRTDGNGNTWVHYAIWLAGAKDLEEELLSSAAAAAAAASSSNAFLAQNASMQTPLHLACMRGDLRMIRLLMDVIGRLAKMICVIMQKQI